MDRIFFSRAATINIHASQASNKPTDLATRLGRSLPSFVAWQGVPN
jgi:hypothetical protein